MGLVEKTIEVGGARYAVRRITTRGLLRLLELLAGCPEAARALASADDGERLRGAGPLIAGMVELLLTHCVRPAPLLDEIAPDDATQLLEAAHELNPLSQVLEAFNRFFVAVAPAAREAAEASERLTAMTAGSD